MEDHTHVRSTPSRMGIKHKLLKRVGLRSYLCAAHINGTNGVADVYRWLSYLGPMGLFGCRDALSASFARSLVHASGSACRRWHGA